MATKKIFQPTDLLKVFGVKPTEENIELISSVLSMIVYLKKGTSIESSSVIVTKLEEDLFTCYVKSHNAIVKNYMDSVDSLTLPS